MDPKEFWNGDNPPLLPLLPFSIGIPFESVERRVEISTEEWAKDLRGLFLNAQNRFGDVCWESQEGQEKVWGHKAVIYARAPKAFKERYFISRPFSRSPTSLRSPSPHLLPSLFPPSNGPSSYSRLSPSNLGSTLSVNTYRSEGTIRPSANEDTILRLVHGDTPELFRAQLEWLYTGEGFGDVVEWISAEDDSSLGNSGSIRDSLGRRGNIHERRDKLGQDLTYMWRSKLYADIRIHLDQSETSSTLSGSEGGSEDSTDSLSSTASFTSHKFILASRSPYFASLLLNPDLFSDHKGDVYLPTPPFTPASLHFCLGWMYAGHLDFSNRTFDLTTAFQIHRAATYLQLDTLVAEIEAGVVYDFCHGFTSPKGKVHCKKCPFRAARAWRFASSSDVAAVKLAAKAKDYIVTFWGDSWGREIALAEETDREELVQKVVQGIKAENVIAAFRSIEVVKARLENALRTRGREAAAWVGILEHTLEKIQSACRDILLKHFTKIAEGKEMWDLIGGLGFNSDLLDSVGKEVVAAISTSTGCIEGPRVYQSLVSSILLKLDPRTLQTVLPARDQSRQQVETIKEGVLGQIRRRWMQVRDGGGFDGIENWALKEISDEIEVSVDDLLAAIRLMPKRAEFAPPPRSSPPPLHVAGSSRILARPRPVPREQDETSVRGSRISSASRHAPTRPFTPPDPSGLRRLRLSSSASTNSVTSARSTPAPRPEVAESMSGPRARSPTAARQGSTVTIGAGRRSRLNETASPGPSTRTNRTSQTTAPIPRSISGPPRPLSMKPTRPAPEAKTRSASPAPSTTSIKTTKTARSVATVTTVSAAKQGALPKTANAEAGPSRLRTVSASATTSARKSEASNPVPQLPSLRTVSTPLVGKEKGQLDQTASRQRTASAATATSVKSRVASINSRAQATSVKPPPLPSKGPAVLGRPIAVAPGRTPSSADKTAASASTVERPPSVAPSMASRTTIASRQTVRTAPQSAPSTPGRGPSRSTASASTASPSKTSTSGNAKSTVSPARSRLASTKSTVSAVSTVAESGKNGRPALRPMKPVAFPLGPHADTLPALSRSKPSPRSASSSTDDAPEARTPRLSHLATLPEPRILRDGSDVSDLNLPNASSRGSSPSKPPPVALHMPRTTRKISSSSTKSTSSIIRLHPASAFDPPKRIDIPLEPLLSGSDILPPGIERFDGNGVELNVGIPCIVSLSSKRARFRAAIKYIGHLKGSRGPWVGIEVDDLDRLGVETLPRGVQSGIHYFHLTPPQEEYIDENKISRRRKLEQIRETLRKTAKSINSLTVDPQFGAKRAISPFMDFNMGGGGYTGFENPRAMFVRPSEIVFVMGAE